MKTCREVMMPFIQRYYDFTEHDLIGMMAQYTSQTFLDIRERLRIPFDLEDVDLIILVGTDLHEYIEAAEIKKVFGKIILVDRKSKEWQNAYKVAHPVAIKLEALFYRENKMQYLATMTLVRNVEVFD